ncbi:Protein ccc1 [Rhizophlyctis rosea]|nr:Protein ccc1 [Rhizophlyctis rosea]
MQCLVTAGRVVQGLGVEEVVLGVKWVGGGGGCEGAKGIPRRAVGVTVCLAMGLVFVRELEWLAGVVSMCFLLNYTTTNLSTFLLSLFHPPSWRPRFTHHHPSLSLLGALTSIALMFTLNWPPPSSPSSSLSSYIITSSL